MAGSLFLGYAFGAIIVGMISDNFGRKFAFVLGNTFSLLLSVILCYVKGSYQFVTLIMLFGMSCGISFPSSTTLVSEISNCQVRANIIGICGVISPIGGIAGLYIAKLNNTYDYNTNNWVVLHEYRILVVKFTI